MSGELPDRIAEAERALEQRPDGHLPLPLRRRVRAAMGSHEHRLRLARRTAERVLPRWRAERPGDERPDELIALAERVRAGEADREEAVHTAHNFMNDVYALLDEEVSEPAVNAAMAAERLIAAARWDDDAERLDETDDDDDSDGYDWETAFYASLVDAPSLPKEGVAEHVEPRRAFWRWYLDQAARPD
jgi:Immunity protein Imm5